jgi:hypothetical protein
LVRHDFRLFWGGDDGYAWGAALVRLWKPGIW